MKGKLILLMVLAAICPMGSQAHGTADILSALKNAKCYESDVKFTVSMPQLSEDVVYDVKLWSTAVDNDRLLGCDYLIRWNLTGREEPVTGFSAYFDGHHYRYSGERLQEYHMEWDSIPFMPKRLSGLKGDGVQRNAQFANLLPQVIGEDLERMINDDRYSVTFHPDTLISGERRMVLDVDMAINGEITMESEYVFDPSTMMPLRIQFENNPGSVSEQSVSVSYDGTRFSKDCAPLSEEALISLYPQVFENFRENNFRIENLSGTKLPGFSMPTVTGERYSRRTGDAFAVPTLIAIIEPGVGFNAELIKALRGAVDSLPFEADVIWAFTTTNADQIEELMPSPRKGEHMLMNARGLARDCGATALPVVILADTKGMVRDVELGYNNNLQSVVIQKMALIKP